MPYTVYVNLDQVINNIETGGLLVGNNAEWAKEAVFNSDHIVIDYFVPIKAIDDMLKYCREKFDYYAHFTVNYSDKADCYNDFINMLKCLTMEDDEA